MNSLSYIKTAAAGLLMAELLLGFGAVAFASPIPEATFAIYEFPVKQLAQYDQSQPQDQVQETPQVTVASTGLSNTAWIIIIAVGAILIIVSLVIMASRTT